MEPGSQADTPPQRASQRLADVVGTLIALLTLIIPVVAIAYFSSTNISPSQLPPYSLLNSKD